MNDRTINEHYIKEIRRRSYEPLILQEMNDTVDRTTFIRGHPKSVAVSPVTNSFTPYRAKTPTVVVSTHDSINQNKQEIERRKADEARDLALLEKLEQIVLRHEQLETVKKHGKQASQDRNDSITNLPQINISIPLFDSVLDRLKSIEKKVDNFEKILKDSKLEDNNYEMQLQNDVHEVLQLQKEQNQQLFSDLSNKIIELISENTMLNTKMNQLIDAIEHSKTAAHTSEILFENKMNSNDSSVEDLSSPLMSPPVEVRTGPRPSQAFIRFSSFSQEHHHTDQTTSGTNETPNESNGV